MSHSHKRHPFSGITTSESEKEDKRIEHHRERAAERAALASATEDADVPPRPRGQYWDKDGKHMFDPAEFPKLFRK